jgi:hypothetical protein
MNDADFTVCAFENTHPDEYIIIFIWQLGFYIDSYFLFNVIKIFHVHQSCCMINGSKKSTYIF